MDFIKREIELSNLEERFKDKHNIVLLYGRMRVGKTALVKKFIEEKQALYFLATEENEAMQIKGFSRALSQFKKQDLSMNKVESWKDLFQSFASFDTNSKKVLVIDDFQYVLTANPSFVSEFKEAWNDILSKQNIMVIFIFSLHINLIIEQIKECGISPLEIFLKPLSFLKILDYYKSFSNALERYAVTGGVPMYLEFFDNNNPLRNNMKSVIFSPKGFLYNEPSFLINKEFREMANYFSIMKVIAEGKHKISEISLELKVKNNKLSPYLEKLIEAQLLEKRIPVNEMAKKKSRKGLFYIKDIFTLFWFKYVFPYKTDLEMGNIDVVIDEINPRFMSEHISHIYERVCQEMFIFFCEEDDIKFKHEYIGSYGDKDKRIALVAVNNKDKKIFAGECIYSEDNELVDEKVYLKLKEKCKNEDFKGYDITYGIFSNIGFTENLQKISEQEKGLLLIQKDSVIQRRDISGIISKN